EEAPRDAVGIVVLVVDVLVVLAVVRGPVEGGILKGGRTEEQGGELDGASGLEGLVGEESVVAERDAHARGGKENHEEGDLEPIQSVVSDVEGNADEGDEEGDNEE